MNKNDSSVLSGMPSCYAFLFMAAMITVMCMPGYGVTYYVSNSGSDEQDGMTPETAWASLNRLNSAIIEPGDSILFRRGDQWRGQLLPANGKESAVVRYGAYGKGEKPVLVGSVEKNRTEEWVDEGANIWSTREPRPEEVNLLKPTNAVEETSGWRFYRENGAEAQFSIEEPGMHVESTLQGQAGSDMQLYSMPFSIRSGSVYLLTFRAKCSVPISLDVPTLMRNSPPWSAYGTWASNTRFPLTAEWRECSCYYMTSRNAEDARITFFLGKAIPVGARLSLEQVRLTECHVEGFLKNDVGNIIFDKEASCGIKVWEQEGLDAQDKYWYDEARHIVKIYSTANPASLHTDIECAIREHIIDQTNRHYVLYENLALKYGAAHGIGGGNAHHITVRDCDISYIGGGDQNGGDKTVRYGNGIEFWATAHDSLVERCRLWEIYDAALTNQSGGPDTPQFNIVYRYNVIWNCEYSFEYWNRPETSTTRDIHFEHNTCFNAGFGWGHAQRPDPSGRHLCFYTSPAFAENIQITGNIFCDARGNGFYAPSWSREAMDKLVMDYNCWFQAEGNMINVAGQEYPMSGFSDYKKEFEKEAHSMTVDPKVRCAAEKDFRLQSDSPCVDAAASTDNDVDIDGVTVPQGNAPDIGACEYKVE